MMDIKEVLFPCFASKFFYKKFTSHADKPGAGRGIKLRLHKISN